MHGFEIVEVALHRPLHEGLKGCFLDLPKAGKREEGHTLEIAGWALGHDGPALGVEILSNGQVFRRVGMDQARPDLVEAFPDIPGADRGGFYTRTSMLGTSDPELTIQAVLRDQTRVPLGKIKVRRRWREHRAGAQAASLVSVIITSSSNDELVEETIESVRKQTFPHFEVLVVQDGSVEAALGKKVPWVTWVQQESPRWANARNTGIRLSAGNYLVFLEAGRRLLPEALEVGLEALKDHSECALVFGDSRSMVADDKPGPHDDEQAGPGGDPYLALLSGCHVPRSAVAIYPREVFEHVPEFADPAGPLLDYAIFLGIARDFPIHYHGKTVAEHRQEDQVVDPGQALQIALSLLRAQRRYLKGNVLRKTAYLEGVQCWRARYGPPLVRQLQASLQAGDWKKAHGAMKILMRFHPAALASWWEGRAF